MTTNKLVIAIPILGNEIELAIFGESNSEETITQSLDAKENGESEFQIKEGHSYEYRLSKGYVLETSEIVTQSKVNESSGRISPNIYVGTLSINILNSDTKENCAQVKLEVRSVKTSYREDYRYMIEEITDKCTELILHHNSPVSQFFETNFDADGKTLYQKFAFIKSILESPEFNDSVYKILMSPVNKWKVSEIIKDIRKVRRITNSSLRQIGGTTNRINLPGSHSLSSTISSIPSKLRVGYKTETVDTVENRFIKYALISFQNFCSDIKSRINIEERLKLEATLLEEKLEQHLSHSIFKEVSSLTAIPLNSPILQRKAGYREILRVWLMFELAAKLAWHGGDDVYSGNKKDVAVLYEYWVFFKLLDIVKEVFKIEPESINQLLKESHEGLNLQLRQGQYFPIKGIYEGDTRKLEIEFSYNKTFKGGSNYPEPGSWTKNMRPDYTLSIWPYGIDSYTAEKEELIAHIHFDAKYKVENLTEILGKDSEFTNEKQEQKRGTFKRIDLLKMHAYKDAIRRTAGSYVLYPGSDLPYNKSGFHELIPGLGAFSLKPSKTNSGTLELKRFLKEVIRHFLNRTSQREKMSFKTYETQNANITELNESLPEPMGKNRDLLPDETFVIVGFYDSSDKFDWISKHNLYNFRTGSKRGSIAITLKEISARYLLLHSHGEANSTSHLYKLRNNGPKIFSKQELIRKNYPNPQGELYLVYSLDTEVEAEFQHMKWNVSKLPGYNSGRKSGFPFTVTLTELMKVLIK